jgi:RND superfamily putative drug exporter
MPPTIDAFLPKIFDALARAVYRFRWPVLVGCLALSSLGGYAGMGVEHSLYGSTVEIPGSASGRVSTALGNSFATSTANVAVVTIHANQLTFASPAFQAALAEASRRLRERSEITRTLSSLDSHDVRLHSHDGHTALILLGLSAPTAQDAERATPIIRGVVSPALASLKQADPSAYWATTGAGALAYDVAQHGVADGQRAEAAILPLTLIILLVAFGALVAAGVPLLMGMLSTATTLGLVALVAQHQPLSIAVQNVATMLGLAVGIDYSLLIIGRFREALARDLPVEDALAEAMRTAGLAVACSGGTVMIGLAALAATPSLNTRSIGVGGALVVLVGVSLALTLLPAVLAILGHRIDAPASLHRKLAGVSAGRRWTGWAAWVSARPKRLAAIGLVVLLSMSAPLLTLETDFAKHDLLPHYDLEFQRGLDLLSAMGRKNAGTPVQLLVTAKDGAILAGSNLDALLSLSRAVRLDPRVSEVIGPVDLNSTWDAAKYHRFYAHWQTLQTFASEKFGAGVSRDGRQALLQVVPQNDQRFEQVQALARDLGRLAAPPQVEVLVGGQAALYNDVHYALLGSVPYLLAFVISTTFLMLALVYRSWLVPLKATLLNLLSVGAGAGALVVIFQWGWGLALLGLQKPTGGIPPSILTTIFCVVFGLSMDYEVFLLGRIKESFDANQDNAAAVQEGLAATGGVITAAALIMVTVFAGFAGVQLVMVQMLGVGLAVAVFVDATIVRVLLAPALMLLAGHWNWYPGYKHGRGAPRL